MERRPRQRRRLLANLQKIRLPPAGTRHYGWARLCQVIANFFRPDGLSIGIGPYEELDRNNGDNGVYIIKDWQIVGREYAPDEEQCEYDIDNFITEVISRQPERPTPEPEYPAMRAAHTAPANN